MWRADSFLVFNSGENGSVELGLSWTGSLDTDFSMAVDGEA